MNGFFNTLLRIDLENGDYRYETLSDDILSKTLGGKGLGTYLLSRENPVGVDPLSAENVFIIAVGPVTGTSMWSQSRFGVYAKSPAGGGYGESYCGGSLAPKFSHSNRCSLSLTARRVLRRNTSLGAAQYSRRVRSP